MGKRKNKNFYAICFFNENRTEIVNNWAECQKKMKGHSNLFKGFMTEEEAKQWLDSMTPADIEKHKANASNHKSKPARAGAKTYIVTLDREHSKALDKFLSQSKIDISQYLKEIIELDLMET